MSFQRICEAAERDFWDYKKTDTDLDDKAMSVILRGLETRPDRTDGNTFWDDFINVISNNSEGAASLLGVNRTVISRWANKIKEGMERVREDNDPEMANTGVSAD